MKEEILETQAKPLLRPFAKSPLLYEVRFCRYFRPKTKSSQEFLSFFFDFKEFYIDPVHDSVIHFGVKRKLS